MCQFKYMLLKYVSSLVCWHAILVKHHPRFTYCETLPALLHKLSIATSKHLHNILKIAPASEFTCCGTLDVFSKPHASLRSHETVRAQIQWSPGQNMAWRDRWTEENAVCHHSLDQLSYVATNQQRACWGCSPGEASSYFPISVTRETNRDSTQHTQGREWKQEEGRWRRRGWERIRLLCWRARCKGKERERGERDRKRESETGEAGRETNTERCRAGISFLWGEQIKRLWQQFGQNNIRSRDRQTAGQGLSQKIVIHYGGHWKGMWRRTGLQLGSIN